MSGYIGVLPVPQTTQTRESFTATAGQTSFGTSGYQIDHLDVYLNGVKLAAADYTATNGSDIVLATGAALNDILEMVAFETFTIANQSFTGTTTVDTLVVTNTVDGRDVSVDGAKLDTIPIISTSSTPSFTAKGDGTTDGYIQLNCSQNSHGIKLKSPPHSANASYTLTFPNDDGNAGQFLKTNGSGVLSWATDSTTDSTKLPLAGGAMTGPITTNSTFDGVDVATRDAVLTSTTTTANAALPKAGGVLTGAVTTNSTFDGRDVATDGTKLDTVETNADVTDTANVTSAGALMDSELTNLAAVKAINQSLVTTASPTFAGMATTANVTFGDNDKAIFGASSDLQIFHDGTNSYSAISDQGTGPLVLLSNNLLVQNAGGTENMIKALDGGAVELYHNNVKMFETTSAGATVTGNLSTSGSVTTGGNLHIAPTSNTPYITGGAVSTVFRNNANNASLITILNGGNVGIGAASPAYQLTLSSNSTYWEAGLQTTVTGSTQSLKIISDAHGGGGRLGDIRFFTNGAADGDEKMRIDSTGNFLAATTDTSLFNNTTGGGFMVAGSSGRTDMARQANVVATMNRTGNSDGDILEFRKDGSIVGSIGTLGSRMLIGTGDTGLFFNDQTDQIQPINTTTNAPRDNAISLGTSNRRFKDLYLSGGVVFGPASASTVYNETLSTYEKGYFSGRLSSGYTGSVTHFSAVNTGYYTRVGDLVHFQIHLNNAVSGGSAGQAVWLTGLPFTVSQYTTVSHWFYGGLSNITAGYVPILRTQINGTAIVFQKFKDGVGSEITYQMFGGSINIIITGTYHTA